MPGERSYRLGDLEFDMMPGMSRPDFLDEIVAERTNQNPQFPVLLDAAIRRRELLEELAAERESLGLSQTVVAARMQTSQSAVARLESADVDAKLSTVERYAAALGKKIDWHLVDV